MMEKVKMKGQGQEREKVKARGQGQERTGSSCASLAGGTRSVASAKAEGRKTAKSALRLAAIALAFAIAYIALALALAAFAASGGGLRHGLALRGAAAGGREKTPFVHFDGQSVVKMFYSTERDYRLEMDFDVSECVSGTKVVGNRDRVGVWAKIWCTVVVSGGRHYVGSESSPNATYNVEVENGRVKMTRTPSGIVVNGVALAIQGDDYTLDFIVGGFRTATPSFVGKIYRVRLYESGVLAHDLVPTNVGGVGFYDRVDGTYHYNETAGTLTYGVE